MNNEWWIAEKKPLLDLFSKLCSGKYYRKIPYAQWKKLLDSETSYFLIREIFENYYRKIEVYKNNYGVPEEPLFECSARGLTAYDNGFAKFLCNHWGEFKPEETETEIKNNMEENNMKTDNLINFEFGPVSNTQFRISPYGIAIATNSNGWVAYNSKTEEVFNVDIINFDISKFIYKMPVAMNDIKPGDILIHSEKPVFVRKVNENGTVSVLNYANSTVVDILPVKSPFGFNFFTKICSLIDLNTISADADNPFGNILPFLIFSGENKENFDPSMLLFFNKDNNIFNNNNPLFFYLLFNKNKGDMNDFLPLLLLNQTNTSFNLNSMLEAPSNVIKSNTLPSAE
jgi:hypothetical protein